MFDRKSGSMLLESLAALLFTMCNRVESASVGLIPNVSLVGQQGVEINQTSCAQCLCLLLPNSSFVSLNCYKANGTCELFTAYNATVEYGVKDNLNSHFYFNELPPTVLTTVTPKATTVTVKTTAKFDSGILLAIRSVTVLNPSHQPQPHPLNMDNSLFEFLVTTRKESTVAATTSAFGRL